MHLHAFTTTLCPNSIETTHQTLPQNNILAGESGDIQSPNQKKTTRCWLMRASHRKSPTNKHPEASSVNAVASNDIRRQLLPLQLVTPLPEWTGTLGHLGHLTRRNYIKGGIPNFSNHRSHVFFHVPFRVEGWGMSRHLMVFYVCRHGIDRNASSLVPLQEPRKDDQFANKTKGQTLMAAHTFRKGHCFGFPQHWLKKSGQYLRLTPFQKGPQNTRKLRCSSIQLDFVAKGCTGNLLNTKPKPMILNAFFG